MSRPLHFDKLPSRRRQAVYRLVAGAALAGLLVQLAWQYGRRDPDVAAQSHAAAPVPAPHDPAVPRANPPTLAPPRPAARDTATAHAMAAPADPGGRETYELNAGIDPATLTTSRPMAAQAFLREVWISPDPRGGYVVRQVLADGVYDRMGLRAGDRLYSLDTPAMAAVDEGSMVAVMQQAEIEMDVWRDGTPTRLHVALNEDPHAPAAQE
jgi:hypothetical protein